MMDKKFLYAFLEQINAMGPRRLKAAEQYFRLGLQCLEQAYTGEVNLMVYLKQACQFWVQALCVQREEPRIYLALAWVFGLMQRRELLEAYLDMAWGYSQESMRVQQVHRLLQQQLHSWQRQGIHATLNAQIAPHEHFFDLLKRFILQEVQELTSRPLPEVRPQARTVYELQAILEHYQLYQRFVSAHLQLLAGAPQQQELKTWLHPLAVLIQRLDQRYRAAHSMLHLRQRLEHRLQQVQRLSQATRQRGTVCARFQEALATLCADCQSMSLDLDELTRQNFLPTALLPLYARLGAEVDHLKKLEHDLPKRALPPRQGLPEHWFRSSLAS